MADLASQVGIDQLFAVDPDDPRAPSQRIANALRALILTGRAEAGQRLPSQTMLARHYSVARETVKAALRILDHDGLIVSRQGSGVFVRHRRDESLDPRALLRKAFDRPNVAIDYAGFNAETLSNTIDRALEDVREGRSHPSSVRLRLLLADPSEPLAFPRPIDARADRRAAQRAVGGLTRRAVDKLRSGVEELVTGGFVRAGTVEVRLHGMAPMFKLYLLDDSTALFGFNPVGEHGISVAGKEVPMYFPSGWEGTLFGPEPPGPGVRTTGTSFVEQAHAWFDSVWLRLSQAYDR